LCDIASLMALVAAAKQHDNPLAASDEVHAVTWTVVDPQFRHAGTDRLHIAGIAKRESTDVDRDPGTGVTIPQASEPRSECLGLPNLDQT
jgi:hypothetical protein